jgi:hypothetical protein
LVAEAHSIRNQYLKTNEVQQMRLLNKIDVPFQLSLIVDAARGSELDMEDH